MVMQLFAVQNLNNNEKQRRWGRYFAAGPRTSVSIFMTVPQVAALAP